jgi:hypothetical protein
MLRIVPFKFPPPATASRPDQIAVLKGYPMVSAALTHTAFHTPFSCKLPDTTHAGKSHITTEYSTQD